MVVVMSGGYEWLVVISGDDAARDRLRGIDLS